MQIYFCCILYRKKDFRTQITASRSKTAQLVAAQQGLAIADQGVSVVSNAYNSDISKDFFAQGAITHKIIYGIILGGVGYVVATFATGKGLGGIAKDTSRGAINLFPIIGPIVNRVDKAVSEEEEPTFLGQYGGLIGGASGIVARFILG